ncbi:MAG: MMPL family transporter [Desulfobacterales bacterium]|nr:MMPL family transporter [Desulfobacterales bacterium]
MKPFKERIIDFSVTRYRLVMVCTLVLTLATGAFFPLVKMDTDPENMLEITEPARVFHNAAKKRFDLSDTVVLGVINEKDPDGVFNPNTLKRIYELTKFAKTLRWPDENNPARMSGVIEADMIAPSLVDHMSRQGPGTIKFEWLMEEPPKTRAQAREIRQKALSNPLLKGQMISGDGRAICIYLPLTDKLLSYKVYKALQEKTGAFTGDDQFHITGLPVAEGAIGVEMFTQMSTASPLAMAVIFALLFLFFRKWRIIILPMIIATVSIVAAMGLMIAVGFPVHILSSMLPIFLMSIAMVDSVHVLSEFFDVYTPEKGRKETVRQVMSTLFAPMLYTSLTTAAGFLSLTLAPIPPARVFGLFLSIGVMIAWAVTIFFVPAYIMMMPEKALADFGLTAQGGRKSWLVRPLAALGRFTHRRAALILVLLVAGIMVSIWGINQIRINDNYAKRFDLSHPIRQADTALNKHFGGTYMAYLVLESPGLQRPDRFEIQKLTQGLAEFALTIEDEFPRAPDLAANLARELPGIAQDASDFYAFVNGVGHHLDKMAVGASEETAFTLRELQVFFELERERNKPFKRPEVLSYMADLQDHLLETGLIGKASSVADVVRKVNQELTDGRPESFAIPRRFQSVSECYLQYQQSHRPNDLWHMVTPDYSHANIRLQFPTGDSINTKATVAEVRSYVEANPLPASLTYRWAGLHYINLVLEGKLVWGFLKSFAGSFLIVFIMMSYLFRSLLWGGLCMVPLTITLGAIYGITGIVGKDYDLPIAVLSALSIGMAVDFAIHFLERSRAGYREKGNWGRVVGHMFGEPARAISRNVLVIAIGFLPLLVASLVPYKTTGIMLFMILSCSGLITLLALPAILTIGEKFFFKGLYPGKEPERKIKKKDLVHTS